MTEEREQLKSKVAGLNVDLDGIENELRYDPVAMVRAAITDAKKGVEDNKQLIVELRPTLEDMRARLRVLDDRQRNEHEYREKERKRAEDGKREAERVLARADSERARQQLELLGMDVEECHKQLEAEKTALKKLEQERDALRGERQTIADRCNAAKVCLRAYCLLVVTLSSSQFQAKGDKAKANFDEFNRQYKDFDDEVRQKQQYILQIKKTVRNIETEQNNFPQELAEAKRRLASYDKTVCEACARRVPCNDRLVFRLKKSKTKTRGSKRSASISTCPTRSTIFAIRRPSALNTRSTVCAIVVATLRSALT